MTASWPMAGAFLERAPIMEAWRRWARAPLLVRALIVVIGATNFVLLAITLAGFGVGGAGYDWAIYREAGRRVIEGGLYTWEGQYAWSYSPLLAYAFALIAPIGFLGWSILHGAALLALRPRSLAVLSVLLWPFWVDVYNGNTMVFVFVAAAGAVRREKVATFAFLLFCLLMPRPLMLPMLIWIGWRQPGWRLPFILMLMANAVGIALLGYGGAWLHTLVSVSGAVTASQRDVGPAAILGSSWIAIGVVLALLLIRQGRLGWASMAASPYWLPQYLLMLVLELVPVQRVSAGAGARKVDASPAGEQGRSP